VRRSHQYTRDGPFSSFELAGLEDAYLLATSRQVVPA
jgi:hypothetical protein